MERMVVFNAVVSLTRDKSEASLKTIITAEIMFGRQNRIKF